MTIRIPCFRKIVGRPLVWCLFLLHFFHKKNLGMGFLEYIMSSSKWKYFYSASILGHIVIYYILQMIKYLIIIHYKNIFKNGFIAQIYFFIIKPLIFFCNQNYRKIYFLLRTFMDIHMLLKIWILSKSILKINAEVGSCIERGIIVSKQHWNIISNQYMDVK